MKRVLTVGCVNIKRRERHLGKSLTRRLTSDSLEDIIHEGVENCHRLVGYTRIRMHLLEH
jgi:hypothetical protein